MARKSIIRGATMLLVLVAGALTACRADDSGTVSDPVDIDAYCAAALALESAQPPDFGTTTSVDEIAEIVRDYARGTLVPLLDTAIDASPDEITESLEVMKSAAEGAADSGNLDEFDSASFVDATQGIHDYDLGACGWQQIDVAATEYAFSGLPATLLPGPVSFEISNQGAEYHEMVLVRKNAGVTQSAQELLALPDEEALNLVTFVNQGAADPGDIGYLVADLSPGAYVVACFVPVGTASADAESNPDAEPHATRGMFGEFTVS